MSIRKRGKYWYCDVTINGQRYHRSLKTTNKRIADEKRREIERKLILGDTDKDNDVLISTAYDEYIRDISAIRRPKTVIEKKSRLGKIVIFWKNKGISKLRDVTPRSITEFREEFMAGKITNNKTPHPATYNHYLKCAKAFLNWVIKNRPDYLKVNPIQYCERIPNIYRRRFRYFTKDELNNIWSVVVDPVSLAFFKILVNTGLRLSELIHLEWKNVDLKKRVIKIENKPQYNWTVKTYQERTIALNETAFEIFKSLPTSESFVFPHKSIWYWSRRFRKALGLAGINDKRLADLRHTFGAHHALANTNPFALQQMMGHSDISTTQIYVNLRADDISSMADNINL